MILVHHLRIGRSLYTVWLLEELGLDYELKIYLRDDKTHRAQDDLKAVHPLGKSPMIEDGDVFLTESGAIATYLIDAYDREFRLAPPPSDVVARARYNQWLHYSEGSLFGPLLTKMVLMRSRSEAPAMHEWADGEIKLHLTYLDNCLGDNDYLLGGQLQGPDFGMGTPLNLARRLGLLDDHPNLVAYLERMQSRPAFLRAKERAGE